MRLDGGRVMLGRTAQQPHGRGELAVAQRAVHVVADDDEPDFESRAGADGDWCAKCRRRSLAWLAVVRREATSPAAHRVHGQAALLISDEPAAAPAVRVIGRRNRLHFHERVRWCDRPAARRTWRSASAHSTMPRPARWSAA